MPFFLMLFGALAICVFIYFYFFSGRLCTAFSISPKGWRVRLIRAAAALIIAGISVLVSGYGIAFLLYFILGDISVLIISWIISLLTRGKEYKWRGTWRRVSRSGLLQVIIAVIVIILGYFNFHNIVKTEYTVYTEKDMERSYRVAFISDVHFGVSLDIEELRGVCDEISREGADLVVLGGDIVDDGTKKEELAPLFDAFGDIESTYGVFYVFGNHDRSMRALGSGYTTEELVEAIESADIKILCDEVYEINGDLALIGRDDRGFQGGERKAIEDLVSMTEKERFLLNLDHQPKELVKNGEAGVDLIISGHTHGGQLWPVNIIDNILKINELNYGLAETGDGTSAIVSSGLAGWGFPVKTSAPAEYVMVNIEKR